MLLRESSWRVSCIFDGIRTTSNDSLLLFTFFFVSGRRARCCGFIAGNCTILGGARIMASTTSWSRPVFHSGYAELQSMRIASSPSRDKGKTTRLHNFLRGNSSHATVPRSFSRMWFLNRFVWSWSSIRKYSPLTGTVGRPCCSADSLLRRCCSMPAHRRHA